MSYEKSMTWPKKKKLQEARLRKGILTAKRMRKTGEASQIRTTNNTIPNGHPISKVNGRSISSSKLKKQNKEPKN